MITELHPILIPCAQWREERDAYLRVVGPFVQKRRERRSRAEKHPVEDFLWEYYSLRGSRLLKWHPGAGKCLEGAGEEDVSSADGYVATEDGRVLDTERVLARRTSGVRWIGNLLETLDARPPVFSCLGLHEWAMVYEEKDIRHPQVPLRLSHAETRQVVESFPLHCTHFDAFRFFSESARPMNAVPLQSERRTQQEQPGCLHVHMDLFKWCMKLQPLISSKLTLDCFRLACRARDVDMRASPYDLSAFQKEPICIETAAGRKEYVRAQQEISQEAGPLRRRLIDEFRFLEHDSL